MSNFLCQNVSLFLLYILLTKRVNTIWSKGITQEKSPIFTRIFNYTKSSSKISYAKLNQNHHFIYYLHTTQTAYQLRSQSFRVPKILKKLTMLKNLKVLLHICFHYISLNVQRPNFFNMCNLPLSYFPNIKAIRVKFGPNISYFSYFMSSCTNRIAVFYMILFH